MKNLIKFFMVMAVLCMTACSQTFEDVSNNAKPQEKGRLVMNVGSRSRTIMPTVDTLKSNIKSATLTANNTEIRSWSWSGDNGDNVINQIESDNSILLDVGTYNFEMKFYNGTNDVILSGTINNQDIKTGDNELTFDMKIAGNGKISIELSRGADSGINKIKAGLYDIATGEAVKNYEPEELTISDTQVTYSKDNVQAGQYIIKFEIYDATNKLLNTLTDVIEVIGGITTTHQITLNNINTQYYTITYNLDGGEWKGFTPITKRNANTKVTLPTADKINKTDANNTNCIFGVWYDGNGNVITEISSGTTEDITVTAVWGTIKGTNTVEWYTTANTVAAVIETLSGEYTHDIVVTEEISNTTISAIKTALQSKSNAKVNLDLRETTGLNELPSSAFQGCTGLTSVTIPDSVKSISDSAFSGCSRLENVTIPDSVTTIGSHAFNGCTGLTRFIVSTNNANFSTSDDGKILYNKDKTALIAYPSATGDVTIPDSVTTIGDSAFDGCSSLESVTIPNGVATIGQSAFNGCTGLTSVEIPDSVTSIGSSAFSGCSKLTTVYITDLTAWMKIEFGYGSSNPLYNGADLYLNGSLVTDLVIPDSVISIGKWAFNGCRSLKSVTIPVSVIEIGDSAFYCCDNLTTVNYKGTQEECNKITGINQFGMTINYYSFKVTANDVSSKISDLTEGGSYTIIVTGAIASDTISAIKGALQSNSKAMVNLDLSGTTGLTSIDSGAFNGCTGLTSVTIPAGVTSIGESAFYECKGLTSVTIPAGVTSIGESAFNRCSGLTSVTIPAGVTSIGEYAFNRCIGLTSVTIPAGVTSIGNYAFNCCIGLTSVTIPDSVTSIGDYAFAGCKNLKNVTIGNNVTSIGESAFRECGRLESVVIPDSVTSIAGCAFFECSSLTSVTIPDSVTKIGGSAFNCCTDLTNVTIGNGVTKIGRSAFNCCASLTSVTFKDTNNWYYTSKSNYTGGTVVDVTDSGTNATKLKDTYCSYYWYKAE